METPTDSVPAAPPADVTWESLGLSEEALELIRKSGYTKPTPVQAEAIPIALDGFDVIASAQTGTGKTATFVLPMVEKFAGRQGTFGLILAPTREIAQQIQATIELLGAPRGVRSIVLIGGINMRLDSAALDTYPQIIVATPGRLCDHLDRGNIWLNYIEVVTLDEADRMLDMGFSDQLNRIFEDLPDERQTLLYSATIPPSVDVLAKRILYQPKRVAIGKATSAAHTVEQKLMWMREEDKNRELRRLINHVKGSIIVFTRSKDGATRVWRSLHSAGVYDATYIHSDRLQAHRESALAEFKEGKYRILIATDVAGRGIHVDNVEHVINYDLSMEPEDYVHRIGRTGRAGETGHATTFATARDRGMIRRIEKLIGREIPATGDPEGGGGFRPSNDRGGDRDRGRGGGGGGGRGGDRPRSSGSNGGGGSTPPRRSDGPVATHGHAAIHHPEHKDAEKRLTDPVLHPHAHVKASDGPKGERPAEGTEGAAAGPAGEGDPLKRRRRRGRRGGRGRNPGGGGGGEGGNGGGGAPSAT